MRTLYPPVEPFNTFMMPVSDGHEIYVEEVGNPKGKPVIFFHGGPGGGIEEKHRRYFDPKKWRVILFDQRGCGKSKPFASIENNTTWKLIEDTEQLRKKLGIERWHVFGGSWGSTLSLAYALTHLNRVKGLVLRGIFTLRNSEIQWFYQHGASELYPDAWDNYLAPIPECERSDLVTAYYKRLTSDNPKVVAEAAKAWSVWEGSTSKLIPDEKLVEHFGGDAFSLAFARIECHYFINGGFLEEDGWIIKNAHRLKEIKGVIVQGRYDLPCPVRSAWDLHKAWPEAKLEIISDAGHSASEPGIVDALVRATDAFASDSD